MPTPAIQNTVNTCGKEPRILQVNLVIHCNCTMNSMDWFLYIVLHKRALRMLFNDYEASFEELLQRNNEQTVHTKNLHKLMTEVYKSLNRQNLAFMLDLFIRKEVTYDLRVKDLLELPTARTVLNGLNSIVFRGSILWNAISMR